MNFYEFVMMFFYVSFCTGIISIGCHFTEKMQKMESLNDTIEHVDHVSTQM